MDSTQSIERLKTRTQTLWSLRVEFDGLILTLWFSLHDPSKIEVSLVRFRIQLQSILVTLLSLRVSPLICMLVCLVDVWNVLIVLLVLVLVLACAWTWTLVLVLGVGVVVDRDDFFAAFGVLHIYFEYD